MGTGEFKAGGNPAMDWHPFQGGVEIFLVASCHGNRDKLWADGPLGSYADLLPGCSLPWCSIPHQLCCFYKITKKAMGTEWNIHSSRSGRTNTMLVFTLSDYSFITKFSRHPIMMHGQQRNKLQGWMEMDGLRIEL